MRPGPGRMIAPASWPDRRLTVRMMVTGLGVAANANLTEVTPTSVTRRPLITQGNSPPGR
jgi:hypothetical protein